MVELIIDASTSLPQKILYGGFSHRRSHMVIQYKLSKRRCWRSSNFLSADQMHILMSPLSRSVGVYHLVVVGLAGIVTFFKIDPLVIIH